VLNPQHHSLFQSPTLYLNASEYQKLESWTDDLGLGNEAELERSAPLGRAT
jgi:hypothetical protein